MSSQHKQGWFRASEPPTPCPAADELWGFERGTLAAVRQDEIRAHLTECVWCGEKLARFADPALSTDPAAADGMSVQPPAELDRKLKANWRVDPWKRIWRSQVLWMVLFVASVGVSFADPRHYKQWLVIALVTGIRWGMSERAARHQITLMRSGAGGDTDRSGKRLGRETDLHSRR